MDQDHLNRFSTSLWQVATINFGEIQSREAIQRCETMMDDNGQQASDHISSFWAFG